MYGSSFCIRTFSPLPSSSIPIDALVSPLPNELTTPPVTKMNLVIALDSIRQFTQEWEGEAPAEPRIMPARSASGGNVRRIAPRAHKPRFYRSFQTLQTIADPQPSAGQRPASTSPGRSRGSADVTKFHNKGPTGRLSFTANRAKSHAPISRQGLSPRHLLH